MSEIKMSLYFKLPATDLIRSLSCNACIDSNCDGVGEYEAAELAINSYDANQALITKQAEQIKMLIELVDSANEKLGSVRDALYGQNLSISGWHLNGQLEPVDNWFDSNDWDPVLSIEATKPVEE